jgi:inner membrane protein
MPGGAGPASTCSRRRSSASEWQQHCKRRTVDNLCHTLVGAALGEAGLKRHTRFGSATLMVASNLPDLDVLVFATSTPAIAFRRGWTHGILAQLLLPIALTAVTVLIARVRPPRVRRAGPPGPAESRPDPPLSVAGLLLLSYIGVVLHVFMDYLNNYGVRLLAPFDWRWFYGDAVFIVDPWLWLSLGAGVWLSVSRRTTRPARGALLFAAAYTIVMLLSARAARDVVIRAWQDTRGEAPRALMVGPRPLTPLTRDVIVDAGDHYETGTFSWPVAAVTFDRGGVPKHDTTPSVRLAMDMPPVRYFLSWSRFPFWTIAPAGGQARVTVGDMRFAGFGALRVVGGAARFSATVTVPSTAGD